MAENERFKYDDERDQFVCQGCGRVKNPLTHSCPMHSSPSYKPLEHPNRLFEEPDRVQEPEPDIFLLRRGTHVVFKVACPRCGEVVDIPPVILEPQLLFRYPGPHRLGVASTSEFPVIEHICLDERLL